MCLTWIVEADLALVLDDVALLGAAVDSGLGNAVALPELDDAVAHCE